jgi:hypothetical protein
MIFLQISGFHFANRSESAINWINGVITPLCRTQAYGYSGRKSVQFLQCTVDTV